MFNGRITDKKATVLTKQTKSKEKWNEHGPIRIAAVATAVVSQKHVTNTRQFEINSGVDTNRKRVEEIFEMMIITPTMWTRPTFIPLQTLMNIVLQMVTAAIIIIRGQIFCLRVRFGRFNISVVFIRNRIQMITRITVFQPGRNELLRIDFFVVNLDGQ